MESCRDHALKGELHGLCWPEAQPGEKMKEEYAKPGSFAVAYQNVGVWCSMRGLIFTRALRDASKAR